MSCNWKRQVLKVYPDSGIRKTEKDGKALYVLLTSDGHVLSSTHGHARLAWREVALRIKAELAYKAYYGS